MKDRKKFSWPTAKEGLLFRLANEPMQAVASPSSEMEVIIDGSQERRKTA